MTEEKADQLITLLTQLNTYLSSGEFVSFLWGFGFFLAFAHGFRAGAGGGSREL